MNKLLIPFKNGKFINYPNGYDVEFKENYELETILILDSISRGCSAAHYIVIDEKTKDKYVMFMKDLFDFCNKSSIKNGKLIGKFTFCKRGANYGIKGVF